MWKLRSLHGTCILFLLFVGVINCPYTCLSRFSLIAWLYVTCTASWGRYAQHDRGQNASTGKVAISALAREGCFSYFASVCVVIAGYFVRFCWFCCVRKLFWWLSVCLLFLFLPLGIRLLFICVYQENVKPMFPPAAAHDDLWFPRIVPKESLLLAGRGAGKSIMTVKNHSSNR